MNPTLAWGLHIPNLGDAVRNAKRLGICLMLMFDNSVTAGFSSICSAHWMMAFFSCFQDTASCKNRQELIIPFSVTEIVPEDIFIPKAGGDLPHWGSATVLGKEGEVLIVNLCCR